MTTTRIDRRFADLKNEGRPALVTFVMAGDPDHETSLAILRALPKAGADVIEIGMPFSDPMADGPAVQMSGQRALKAGETLKKTLAMVRAFREGDRDTPMVLMGYYNPIYSMGSAAFLDEAKAAGVDGLIVVDLPPEADDELCLPAIERGLSFIRLATPTTDDKRLPAVLANTSGFVYYVSILGITGTRRARPRPCRRGGDKDQAAHHIAGRGRLRRQDGGPGCCPRPRCRWRGRRVGDRRRGGRVARRRRPRHGGHGQGRDRPRRRSRRRRPRGAGRGRRVGRAGVLS